MNARSDSFPDRREAGRELAEAVAQLGLVDLIVLALPRGGVPVGFEVAKRIKAPLDILLVRKIGAPGLRARVLAALPPSAA
jgi:putative phosphoribosyl transferase